MKISTDSWKKICLYTITSIAPLAICIILGIFVGKLFSDKEIMIYSPQDFFSNLINMMSIIVGFLLTFIGLVLGFAATKSMRTILQNSAPCYKLGCNLVIPLLIGLALVIYILYLSIPVPNDETLIIKGDEMARNISYILAFFSSIIKSTFCLFTIVKSIASEEN